MSAFLLIESGISGGAGSRLFFTTRPPHKFAFTVRTNELHLPGATRAKTALVTANVCDSAWCKSSSALFTYAFKLQPHFLFLRSAPKSFNNKTVVWIAQFFAC